MDETSITRDSLLHPNFENRKLSDNLPVIRIAASYFQRLLAQAQAGAEGNGDNPMSGDADHALLWETDLNSTQLDHLSHMLIQIGVKATEITHYRSGMQAYREGATDALPAHREEQEPPVVVATHGITKREPKERKYPHWYNEVGMESPAYELLHAMFVFETAANIAHGRQREEHKDVTYAEAVESALMYMVSADPGEVERFVGIVKQVAANVSTERLAEWLQRSEQVFRESGEGYML